MKCLVCTKEYSGVECPICRFPNVQITGDYEEGLAKLAPAISAHKDKFFGTIRIGVEILTRNPEDDISVMPMTEKLYFGTLKELVDKDVWLDKSFARIPNDTTVDIKVVIDFGKKAFTKDVQVPNINEVGLQNIGISTKDDLTFALMLKNFKTIGNKSEFVRIIE